MMPLNYSKSHQKIFWILISLFILSTNEYFSIEDVYLNGGADGKDYFSISKDAPRFSDNLAGHKSWRFLFPYLIGLFSKSLGFDIFITYQILIIIIIFNFIYQLNKNFFDTTSFFEKFIFIACIIFNPYFFRYFVSLPLLINDVIFIYGTIFIIKFLNKKKFKHLLISLLIICFARQESIFFVSTMIICKLIYRKKSIFSNKHLFISIFITFLIFLINTYYSINSSRLSGLGYSDGGRIALLYFNYSLYDFIVFVGYSLFSLSLIIVVIFFNLGKIIKNIKSNFKNEKIIFIFILILLIMAPAIIAGPDISGKNILRLSNLPIVLITYLTCLFIKNQKFSKFFKFIFFSMIIIYLQHPKYSISHVFEIVLKY